jgi:hypothetical protein
MCMFIRLQEIKRLWKCVSQFELQIISRFLFFTLCYLGCDISYSYDRNIEQKLSTFQRMCEEKYIER